MIIATSSTTGSIEKDVVGYYVVAHFSYGKGVTLGAKQYEYIWDEKQKWSSGGRVMVVECVKKYDDVWVLRGSVEDFKC